jgi:speckle-type POZ protein
VRQVESVIVPPGNMQLQLSLLLETGNGADVTFDVNGKAFAAHKCILAARSPVFSAQFFGAMKEDSDRIIKIEEIEAPVFNAPLHFIYNDSFSGFEGVNGSERKEETELMAQHLLVAADKYDLERLRMICEKILCGSVDTSNVVTLLSLAERHRCNHLKRECLILLASPGILGSVAETENFQYLLGCHPLICKELSDKGQYNFLFPVVAVLFFFFFTVVLITCIWPGSVIDDITAT